MAEPIAGLSPSHCVPEPFEATVEMETGQYVLHTTPGSMSWDGRILEMPWHGFVEDLAALRVVAEWSASPLNPDYRLGIRHHDAKTFAEHWVHGPVNGDSPLVIETAEPDRNGMGPRLLIDVGTSTEPPASFNVVPTRVKVSVWETYFC